MAVSPGAAAFRRRTAVSLAASMLAASAASAGVTATGLRALTRPSPRRARPAELGVVRLGPTLTSRAGGGTLHTPGGCDLLVDVDGTEAPWPGFWGLRSVDGGTRLLAGPPLRTAGSRAVRPAHVISGEPVAGMRLQLTAAPWGRAAHLLGLRAVERSVRTAIGDLPFTEVSDPSRPSADRAVVFVHGRGAARDDGMWFAPTAARRGWRTVLAGYRNDPDAPATGRYLLGGEWEDVAAVIGELRRDGVGDVVLVGWSMGGNICASYLRQAGDVRVRGLVLDAPALDWRAVLSHVARRSRLPAPFVPAVMGLGRLLEGIDWAGLDHVVDTSHLDLPVLAVHGTDDTTVPASITRHIAGALPDVEMRLVDGAAHCRSVNVDPDGYLAAFDRLLARAERPSARPSGVTPVG